MDMFFEDRSRQNGISVKRNLCPLFPAHFHLELEVFLLARGSYTLTVNGERVTLSAGDIAVVDSYDVHSYDTERMDGTREHAVLIFPFQDLTGFHANRKNYRLKTPVLHDGELCKKLLAITDEYLCNAVSEPIKSAAAELFLALLGEKLDYIEDTRGQEETLVRTILAFVHAHFREELSLSRIARELGYSDAHLSRAFHKYVKMGLPEYVNRLRLEYVARERARDGRRKMMDVVYEAGFKSQQSYYRCKALAQNANGG